MRGLRYRSLNRSRAAVAGSWGARLALGGGGTCRRPDRLDRTNSLAEIGRVAERHPGLKLTIDHLGGLGGLTKLRTTRR